MPIDDRPVELTGPETHALADMAGVQLDLRFTAGLAAQLQRRLKQEGFDKIDELQAMQDAMLIRYGRCFGSNPGVRRAFRIPRAWISDLPEDLREGHRDFLSLRDKHVAHSVNDWELNTPVARVRIDRETGQMSVHSVSVTKQRVVMLSLETIKLMRRLAMTLADRVLGTMKTEQDRLLVVAKAIPPEELKRLLYEGKMKYPGQQKLHLLRRR